MTNIGGSSTGPMIHWFDEAANRLEEFKGLREGWDSYSGLPITRRSMRTCLPRQRGRLLIRPLRPRRLRAEVSRRTSADRLRRTTLGRNSWRVESVSNELLQGSISPPFYRAERECPTYGVPDARRKGVLSGQPLSEESGEFLDERPAEAAHGKEVGTGGAVLCVS